MKKNLLESIKTRFTSSLIQQASLHFGETENTVLRALNTMAPIVLLELTQLTYRPGGEWDLYRQIRKTTVNQTGNPIQYMLDNAWKKDDGWMKIRQVFPGPPIHLLQKIAEVTGTRLSTTEGLLHLTEQVVARWLLNEIRENELNAHGLAIELRENEYYFEKALPRELGVSRLFIPGETVATEEEEEWVLF